MLHHVSFGVNDLARMSGFYDRVTALLGWGRVWDGDKGCGYGPPGGGDILALFVKGADAQAPGPGCHVAFLVPDRAVVDRFYALALELGARDAGPPGLRTHYTPSYYAAFAIDPEGYKIEFFHEADAVKALG